MKRHDIRVPIELLMAEIADWVKVVWIAMRSYQGGGDACYASCRKIGQRCIRQDGNVMDKSQVHAAQKVLEKEGFLLRNEAGKWQCIHPLNVEQGSTKRGMQSVEQDSTTVEHYSTSVEQGSTTVEQGSTRSKNKLLKLTTKTKTKTKNPLPPYSEIVDSWNEFAKPLGIPIVKRMTDARREMIRRNFNEVWPIIEDVYEYVRQDDFYQGKGRPKKPGQKPWVINFEYVWGRRDKALQMSEKLESLKNRSNENGKFSRSRNGSNGISQVESEFAKYLN